MLLWVVIIIVVVIAMYLIVNSGKRAKGRTTSVSNPTSSRPKSPSLPSVHGGRVPVSDGFGTSAGEGGQSSGRKAPEESSTQHEEDDEMARLRKARPFTPGGRSVIPPKSEGG